MTTAVASVRRDEPLSAAARLMWDCDCGALPVLEPGTERVVGTITDRDICMATWSNDRSPSAMPIADAMSRELFACRVCPRCASVTATLADSRAERERVDRDVKRRVRGARSRSTFVLPW